MKKYQALVISLLIFGISSFAQEGLIPESSKILDSIVEYDFTPEHDSLRKSKIILNQSAGGRHKTIAYFKWLNANHLWVHDYSLAHNKIDLYNDESGILEREVKYLWNSSDSDYSKLSETNFDIDSHSHIIYEEQEEWDMMGKSTRGYYKNFEYDSEELLVFENKCEWTISLINWWGKFQHEYAYDSAGNRILHIENDWNPDLKSWQADLKEEWDYQSSRSQVFYINYLWDSNKNEWINNTRWTRTINAGPEWTQEIFQKWNSIDSLWENDRMRDRVYDDMATWKSEKTYSWSDEKSDWVEAKWQERGFDNDGNIALDIIYTWSSEKNDWIGYDKKEMSYDNNGNQILLINNNWDNQSSNWIRDSKIERSFDTRGNRTGNAKYSWINNQWVGIENRGWEYDDDNDIIVYSDLIWNSETSTWITGTKSFYYYKSLSSNPWHNQNNKIRIYPNSTTGIVSLEGLDTPTEIKVLSMDGKLVQNYNFDGKPLDLSYFPEGVYFIILENQNENIVEKIILIR